MAPIFDENGTQLAESVEDLVKSQGLRDKVKQIPEIEKQRDEEKAGREAAQRELAIYKAGLPNTKITELFAKAYDGPSDTESVRKAALEYGLIQSDDSGSGEGSSFDDETQRLQRGSGAASPADAPNELDEFNRLIAAARNSREVQAIYDGDLGKRIRARAATTASSQ